MGSFYVCLTLFVSPHAFKSSFLARLCTSLFSNSLFFPSLPPPLPASHLSSSSLGVRPIRLRVLWESWVLARAAWSQISPLQSHSWPRGLNIERQLTPWQLREKTEAGTDAKTEERRISLDKTPKTSCTEREKKENITKTVRRTEHENTAEHVLQSSTAHVFPKHTTFKMMNVFFPHLPGGNYFHLMSVQCENEFAETWN